MSLLTPAVSSLIVLHPALSPSLLFSTRTTLPRPHSRTAPISLKLSASLSPPPSLAPPKPNPLSNSTRTIATVVGVAFALSKVFTHTLQSLSARLVASGVLPSPDQLLLLQRGLFAAAGPLFFAPHQLPQHAAHRRRRRAGQVVGYIQRGPHGEGAA